MAEDGKELTWEEVSTLDEEEGEEEEEEALTLEVSTVAAAEAETVETAPVDTALVGFAPTEVE